MLDNLLSYARQSDSPIVVALILGLVFALDPCPMLTNIAAIGYVAKDITNKYKVFANGMMYTLGRTLSYGILGYVLMLLLRSGGNISVIENFLDSYGQLILIIFLIVMGVLLIVADYIPGLKMGISAEKLQGKIGTSGWGSFLLGIILSFGFCPTNAVLFFGILVPLSASSVSGALAPFVFAFATALPVILIAWIFSFSLNKIAQVYNSMKRIGVIVRWVVGGLFIVIGLYLAVTTYILPEEHHHHHHDEETELIEACEGEHTDCDHHHHD